MNYAELTLCYMKGGPKKGHPVKNKVATSVGGSRILEIKKGWPAWGQRKDPMGNKKTPDPNITIEQNGCMRGGELTL